MHHLMRLRPFAIRCRPLTLLGHEIVAHVDQLLAELLVHVGNRWQITAQLFRQTLFRDPFLVEFIQIDVAGVCVQL